ncbi:MAG: hydroxymethylglutaryl-CoA lyase [Thermodesulfobacteriota bacterium]
MTAEPTSPAVIIEDETLRDGLQAESRLFSLEEKLALFHLLQGAGFKRIQVGSFVHPKVVPQMAGIEELLRAIGPREDLTLSALILNDKGLERALATGVKHVSMSVSASDTHSRKNARRPAAEALASMTGLIAQARRQGLSVRAGVQCAFGCVYEGRVPEETVLQTAADLIEAGAGEINLADTTGMATPRAVRRLAAETRRRWPEVTLSLHLHDTRGLGLMNMMAGFESGAVIFDACAGGLGGCPFVKGAAGNVPTEDAINMFEAQGVPTGLDIRAVCRAVEELERLLNRPLPGRMTRVLKGLDQIRREA